MRHFRIKQACIPAAEVLTSRPGRKANNSARVAELVDALDSGSSGGNPVKVRVLSRAPSHFQWVKRSKHLPVDTPQGGDKMVTNVGSAYAVRSKTRGSKGRKKGTVS